MLSLYNEKMLRAHRFFQRILYARKRGSDAIRSVDTRTRQTLAVALSQGLLLLLAINIKVKSSLGTHPLG